MSLGERSPGRYFVQHGREESEVLATDQRYLHIGSARQMFVEVLGCVQPVEPAAGNDNPSYLHSIAFVATYCVRLL
jgi:hypothetical protein